MPKEPVNGLTRQPPKRQPPAHKAATPTSAPVVAATQGELVQRAMADPTSLSPAEVASLQRSVGNRAVQRLLARPELPSDPDSDLVVQTKLVVGAAGDAYEREADQVAQDVLRQLQAPSAPERAQRAAAKTGTAPKQDD